MVKAVDPDYVKREASFVREARSDLATYLNGGLKREFLASVEGIFEHAISELDYIAHNPNLSLTATVWVDYEKDVTEYEILNRVDPRSIIEGRPLETFAVDPQNCEMQIRHVMPRTVTALRTLLQLQPLPIRVVVELKAGLLSYGRYYTSAWGKWGEI